MTRPETQTVDATPQPVEPRRILILANPTAGGFRAPVLDRIMAVLRQRGCEPRLHLTSHAGEIAEICAGPLDGVDTLVIAGGDGSVNEALTGLDEAPRRPRLGIVPFGTANVLAHELELPKKPDALAEVIARGRTEALHYGLANGRPFVMMVSSGFDADIVHHVPLRLKRKLGKLAYALTTLTRGVVNRGKDLTVTADGETLTCRLAVVTNMRHYGGPFVICPQTRATAPGLYLVTLARDNPLSLARFSFGLMTNRIPRQRGVTLRPVEDVTITAPAVPAQIDGDPFGTTPIVAHAARDTVPVIVP